MLEPFSAEEAPGRQDGLSLPPGNWWFVRLVRSSRKKPPCYSSCPLAALRFTSHPFLLQKWHTLRVILCWSSNKMRKISSTSLKKVLLHSFNLRNSPTFCDYTLPVLLIFKCAFLYGIMVKAVVEFYLLMFLTDKIKTWLPYGDLHF